MTTAKKNKADRVAWAKMAELAEFRYQLRRFLSFSETASEAAGISAQQYQLLQVIATVPEGQESSISYIAERMVVRHNTAVELVDRAERAGLVHRVADQNDHRRSLVEITSGEMSCWRVGGKASIELEIAGRRWGSCGGCLNRLVKRQGASEKLRRAEEKR